MPVRKRMPREARRVQLLDAAAKLFARSSYGQVTTADLAKAAGVTEPVLYQHFKTKLDLFVALLLRGRDVAFESYSKLAAPMPSPLLKLIAVVRAHGGVMREHEPYFRLHLRALSASDLPRVKQTLKDNYLAYHSYFAGLIRDAQEQGQVDKGADAAQLSWFIMSQGMLMNLARQLGMNELHDQGYVDGLLKDALGHVSLMDNPIGALAGLFASRNGQAPDESE
ncbi:MAG: TetR/AcrR family transcriptional regulator [Planctomycetes bacterium]|nr:TetR/AcrR family transcriptional regulator [Planctomycetota bacterium]